MVWAQATVWAGSIEIKVGLLRSVQNAGVFVAQEKGYFAVEGIQAKNANRQSTIAATLFLADNAKNAFKRS